MAILKGKSKLFPIRSYEGVGPILFGMSPEAVRKALGDRFEVFNKYGWAHPSDAFDGLGIHVRYSPSGLCATVEFGDRSSASPTYEGRELLDEPMDELLRWAERADPNITIDDDGFDSPALGLGVYAPGILDEPDATRASGVTVFGPGGLGQGLL
ncbi:MAG: hypothetical protein M3450_05415 [Actinomycetota bacterium]|nr:hypothetical protein [Actinomycetota bacterium]MDQ3640906.1 hypothetical protein [Actinomycetota bacterium]